MKPKINYSVLIKADVDKIMEMANFTEEQTRVFDLLLKDKYTDIGIMEKTKIPHKRYYETKKDLLALLLKTPILDDFSELNTSKNFHIPSIEKDLFDEYVSTHTTSKGIELKRVLYGIVAKK